MGVATNRLIGALGRLSNRIWILFMILLVTLPIIMLGAGSVYGTSRTWVVDDTGTAEFHGIQEAINAASSGETIHVYAGVYHEQVVANKSVTILGENPANTVIEGIGTGAVVQVMADNVSISNFTIRNGGIGIRLFGFNHASITGNMVRNNGQGIHIEESVGNLVVGNSIIDNGEGIDLKSSSNNVVLNNLVDKFGPGIMMYSCYDNEIRENVVSNSSAYGVYLESCWRNNLTDNLVDVGCEGIHLQNCHNNLLSRNNVTNTGPYGITIEYSSENTVQGCLLTGNELTFQLFHSFGNIVVDNNISKNKYGLLLISSGNNTLENNTLAYNWWSFGVYGGDFTHFVNSIGTTNTVDERPIYYWMNQHDRDVPTDAAYVGLVNSTNINVKDLNLTKGYQGVLLAYSNNTLLCGLDVSANFIGLASFYSSNNTITECVFKGNEFGLQFTQSSYNRIYLNNFVGENLAQVSGVANEWDNGYPCGGNYWSSYTGLDSYSGLLQNLTGSDGIGDIAYAVDGRNRDHFPLVAPINVFEMDISNCTDSEAIIVSNSTISSFHFDPNENPLVRFNVDAQNGSGFCRVAIPEHLLWAGNDSWRVLANGQIVDYSLIHGGDYAFLFFTYGYGTETVMVWGTNAVPEYSFWFLLLFFMFSMATLHRGLLERSKRRNSHGLCQD